MKTPLLKKLYTSIDDHKNAIVAKEEIEDRLRISKRFGTDEQIEMGQKFLKQAQILVNSTRDTMRNLREDYNKKKG